jgi:hypothetical protein
MKWLALNRSCKQLFDASVIVKKPFRRVKDEVFFEITNPTDLTFKLENKSPVMGSPATIGLYPGKNGNCFV